MLWEWPVREGESTKSSFGAHARKPYVAILPIFAKTRHFIQESPNVPS